MRARTDHPVHDVIADRFSPYAFADRPVGDEDLLSLFEAARWAPSSYNEQPWRYIVARKTEPDEFRTFLSCLIETNRVWAGSAPVLALGVVSLKLARTGRPNRAAVHDLGLAAGNLLAEATARGLYVHQMIGIFPERARDVYGIPEDCEAWTALAIGYRGDPAALPDRLSQRDRERRPRRPLRAFVFEGRWGESSPLLVRG